MTAVPEYSAGLAQAFVDRLTFDELDALSGLIDEARKRLAAEPRPDVMYVADVPADGSVEIRWWSHIKNEWSAWRRVASSEIVSPFGQSWRYLIGPNLSLHLDQVVQVRPVMDPQTGQTLGRVA